MKKIALITSGGEGPGINHTVLELALDSQIELWGFHGGFGGIAKEKGFLITGESCKGISISGRQIVKSARSQKTFTKEGRSEIIASLKQMKMDGLIVCGGNGSLEGAKCLDKEGIPTLFIPMSVDNDISGTEYSIGHNTTLNEYVRILQDIHNTACNMPGRIFLVEVPGGDCGILALSTAVSGNANMVILPEYSLDNLEIAQMANEKFKKEGYLVIVCSETSYQKDVYIAGRQGVSFEIGKEIEKETGVRMRHTVLGFYTRGSQPCYYDCIMASLFGALAVENIHKNQFGKMLIVKQGEVCTTDYDKHVPQKKELSQWLLKMATKKDLLIQKQKKSEK